MSCGVPEKLLAGVFLEREHSRDTAVRAMRRAWRNASLTLGRPHYGTIRKQGAGYLAVLLARWGRVKLCAMPALERDLLVLGLVGRVDWFAVADRLIVDVDPFDLAGGGGKEEKHTARLPV